MFSFFGYLLIYLPLRIWGEQNRSKAKERAKQPAKCNKLSNKSLSNNGRVAIILKVSLALVLSLATAPLIITSGGNPVSLHYLTYVNE
jgi:hypothetical protein